jgi:hypothetical protein
MVRSASATSEAFFFGDAWSHMSGPAFAAMFILARLVGRVIQLSPAKPMAGSALM